MFGALNSNIWRLYITEDALYTLAERFPGERVSMVSVRMENAGDEALLGTAYFSEFMGTGGTIWTAHHTHMRQARISNPLIAASMIAVFALILLTVGIIVMRFRIANGIEENMANIGTQKAVGFTSRQIILSIALQFGLIAAMGGLIGILLAQAALPLALGAMRPMFALPWNPAFDPVMMFAAFTSILLLVVMFSYISARRINKLHPLVALRGGITTHSFRKNPLPLAQSPGPLIWLLAFKQLLMNKKQNIMVCLIICVVTVTSVAGLSLHYNMNVNREAFLRMTLGDFADVGFVLRYEGREDVIARIRAHPDVRRLSAMGAQQTVIINGYNFRLETVGDLANHTEYELLDGRFPIHNNEVALGAATLSLLGRSVGDWVSITHDADGTEVTFLVTGSTQSMNHHGMISFDAIRRVRPGFDTNDFGVWLHPGVDANLFIETMQATEGDNISNVLSAQNQIDSFFGPVGELFAAVTAAILTVVAFVVILVLYLVTKTTIIRRRREFGIQKALGFTTFQLMNQIALGMAPTILTGSALGTAIGYFGFNPLYVVVVQSMGTGIVRANLPVPLNWALLTCAALILLAYAVSMLIAWRIRKISAYVLVNE